MKEALLEGPTISSLDEEASTECDEEFARLRLAIMRAVESASAAGSEEDFSSLVLGDPEHAVCKHALRCQVQTSLLMQQLLEGLLTHHTWTYGHAPNVGLHKDRQIDTHKSAAYMQPKSVELCSSPDLKQTSLLLQYLLQTHFQQSGHGDQQLLWKLHL